MFGQSTQEVKSVTQKELPKEKTIGMGTHQSGAHTLEGWVMVS